MNDEQTPQTPEPTSHERGLVSESLFFAAGVAAPYVIDAVKGALSHEAPAAEAAPPAPPAMPDEPPYAPE